MKCLPFAILIPLLASAARATLTDYRAAINAEASLFSYYTFEASNADDTKGTNNGTAQGTVSYSTGAAGGTDLALTLTAAGRINLGTATDFQFTDGTGTIEAWIQANWTTIGYNPCIMANRGGSPTRWSFHMGLAKGDGGIWNGSAYSPQAYPANAGTAWHHAAVVFNAGSTLLYWDGALLATKAQGLGATGQPTQLGSSSATSTAEGWNGKLDEVAFYRDALSTATIAAHYAAFFSGVGPVFTTQPVNTSSVDGGVARLQAVASGGAVTYQWKRGTSNAPGASTSSIYTIDPVSLAADNGATFSCVATNANGSTASDTVTLTVTPPPVGATYYGSAVRAEPSLRAYFPTDGSTANSVANVTIGTYSGTTNGGAGHDSPTGRIVGVRGIGNTGAGWVSLTKDPGWDFTDGSGTVELFAYQPATVSGYNPTLFSVRQDSTGVRYSFHADSAGNLIYFWNGSAAPTWTLPSSGLGRLMHLMFVMNNGQCTCYHNGVSLGVLNNPLGVTLNLPAQIGAAGPSTQEAFVGWIDDVAIYADPLPGSAAQAHYNAWQTTTVGTPPFVGLQPYSQIVDEGTFVSFEFTLDHGAGATYRWQRNGVDMPGGTVSSLGFTATLADNLARYQCIIYTPYGGTSTVPATLTVRDVTPPVLVSASAPYSPGQVILMFNEAVDLTLASFTVDNGGTVTNAVAGPVPGMVVLTVSGLNAGQSATVTAKNVRDGSFNTLYSASRGFTAMPPPVPAPIELVRPGAEPPGPATRRGPFVFSEIHYHPRDRADGKNLEFIELYNSQPWTEDLTGFRITGEVSYSFPNGTSIPAGGRLVIAAVPADVQSGYSISGVLGPWSGALNNSGGQVRLRDQSNGVVFEVNYDSGHPWQPAADGTGHSLVLARPSYGMDDPRAWDISFNLDGSPGEPEPGTADPYRAVVINEVWPTASPPAEFIELYNYSSVAVDVSGCSLSDDREAEKFVIPAATNIPAGGFLYFDQTHLGFGLKAGGDTVYFRAPGGGSGPGRVLDAVRFGPQRGTTFGRWPDGAPAFYILDEDRAGQPNDPPLNKQAVISEIFYNPPAGSALLPFVEITNVWSAPLDVGGWRLSGGVSYEIPAGTVLATDARLAINAFSGTLNGGVGERIRLEVPVAIVEGPAVDTVYSVMDEVTYGTGGRWGRWSDGGGSSLELKDLRSDGRIAANWADSDETGEAGWVTIQNTGLIDNSSGAVINRLHIMMLGAGECLVDDVEVIPGAGSTIITNGGFESGLTGWIVGGTHDGSSLEPSGFSGTASLHVRAAGRGDLAGNRVSVPLNSTPSGTVTIRAKVKWLRGHPEILLRLNGGGLEATGNILPGSMTPGTGGAANSRATANAGPAIHSVTHLPVLPQAGQPATVYARISDPDNISLALLRYRLDPSASVSSVAMSYRGAGIFSADIPAQAAGTLAAFSITAWDVPGAASQFPDDAPARECLVRWGEPTPAGPLPAYHLWMTAATASTWASRPKNSNTPLDVTFAYNNSRVIYNATSQYSGSPFHTGSFTGPAGSACDYDCTVPADDRFLGEREFILAGPGTFGSDSSQIREQTIWWIARQIALPSLHRRFCRVYVNGALRQTVFEDVQQPNGDWLDEYWPGDNDGHLHKAQDWIEFADNGTTFQTDIRATLGRRITTGGVHKTASYRYQWSARSISGSANDFGPLQALVDAQNTGASAADPLYHAALDPLVDEHSWARSLAVQRIAGNWDTWGWSYGKNMYIYKPLAGPWYMTAWDIDFSFGDDGTGNPDPDVATAGLFQNTSNFDGASTGDVLATKFRTQPEFRRAYWCAFLDAVNGPMATATVDARINAMVAALTASGVASNAGQVATVKNYISARRAYILGQINAVYGSTVFGISGSSTITDDDGLLTITGTAPPGVKTIRINGVSYEPAWTSETAWSLPLTLYSTNNSFTVEGIDLRGNVTGSFPLTITVTGPPRVPPVKINEWVADNTSAGNFPDPADGNFEDWFELHNSGAGPVNLSGFFLTDTTANITQFAIPAGTIIPAGGYLLVWADNEAEQNGVTPGQLHANFRLNADGEQIGLYTPDGTQVDLVTFEIQSSDQSQGRYPDGADDIVFPAATPGKRNALPPDIIAVTDAGAGTSTVTITTEPTHVYQIESSADLAAWTSWGAPFTAIAATTNVNLPRSDSRRFWRARIVVP